MWATGAASTALVKSQLLLHSKENKIRMMAEMEKDENKNRVGTWYAAKGIDEGRSVSKILMKEEQAQEERHEKQASRATSSEDAHTSISPVAAAATWQLRGTSKRHDDEQSCAEVKRSKTSSDDSNSVRDTLRALGDEEIREETKKPMLKCLNLCNVDVQNVESKLIENEPTFVKTSSQHSGEARQALKTHQHKRIRCFIDVEERTITRNSAGGLVDTHGEKHREDLDRRPVPTRRSGV